MNSARSIDIEDARTIVHSYRVFLSDGIAHECQNTVKHGPFVGLQLPEHLTTGRFDKGSMCLGTYEREIQDELRAESPYFIHFVDLGAGDGFYAGGMARLGHKVIAYEKDERSRNTIAELTNLNHVTVDIRGEATKGFWRDLPHRCLMLVDIEGGEFDILDAAAFDALSQSTVIVEMHEFFFPNGAELARNLLSNASATHSHSIIRQAARVPPKEVSHLPDNDRWLLMSEARVREQQWWRFDPK